MIMTRGLVFVLFCVLSIFSNMKIASSASFFEEANGGVGGTQWTRIRNGICEELRFEADGSAFIYSNVLKRFEPYGNWSQSGSSIRIAHSSGGWSETAVVSGRTISGDGQNKHGDTWSWKAEYEPPEGDCFYRALYALRAREALGHKPVDPRVWRSKIRPGYEEAIALLERGDILAGDRKLNVLADEGDPRAQTLLAARLAVGGAASRDALPEMAVELYRRAAAVGYAAAENDLGTMYHAGEGVVQDYEMARKWFEFAYLDGEIQAARNLGIIYEFGQGVERNRIEAVNWYRKAAEGGNAQAQARLEEIDYEMLEQREKQRLLRIAASKTPSSDDIERLVTSLYARHYKGRRAIPPNVEVIDSVLFGEVSRTAITAKGISCKSGGGKVADCTFTVNRKFVGGLFYGFENGSGSDRKYSARFEKSSGGWESAELEDQFRNAGQRARQSGSSGTFTGGWSKGRYECQGGQLEDKVTGRAQSFFHPDC
jgi:TPR repeat protein